MSQQNLFVVSCTESGHDYTMAGDGYYKEIEDGIKEGAKDTKKVFRMIYCIKCGDNREICVKDITQPKEIVVEKKKKVSKRRKQ